MCVAFGRFASYKNFGCVSATGPTLMTRWRLNILAVGQKERPTCLVVVLRCLSAARDHARSHVLNATAPIDYSTALKRRKRPAGRYPLIDEKTAPARGKLEAEVSREETPHIGVNSGKGTHSVKAH
jgi:hypothetical protein